MASETADESPFEAWLNSYWAKRDSLAEIVRAERLDDAVAALRRAFEGAAADYDRGLLKAADYAVFFEARLDMARRAGATWRSDR